MFFILASTQLVSGFSRASVDASENYLWFSLTPAMNHGGKKHPGQNKGSGHGRHAGHESEHRPKPVRTYWLNSCAIGPAAKVYLSQPEGTSNSIPITRKGHEVSVSFKTPFGDGPFHGANNLYLVDKSVEKETLVLRTAKWLTIHHSCGWGHDHKFNEERLRSQILAEAPLDIVVDNLWDKNFHSTVMSGDTVSLAVFSYGRPAVGAEVTIISDQGWHKDMMTDKDGRASFQMVRDYYPKSWSLFNPKKLGKFKLTATYDTDSSGKMSGKSYSKAHMNSTFSWRYYPAVREYNSYGYGLLVAVSFFIVSGLGIFLYRRKRTKSYQDIKFDE